MEDVAGTPHVALDSDSPWTTHEPWVEFFYCSLIQWRYSRYSWKNKNTLSHFGKTHWFSDFLATSVMNCLSVLLGLCFVPFLKAPSSSHPLDVLGLSSMSSFTWLPRPSTHLFPLVISPTVTWVPPTGISFYNQPGAIYTSSCPLFFLGLSL